MEEEFTMTSPCDRMFLKYIVMDTRHMEHGVRKHGVWNIVNHCVLAAI